MRKWSSVYQCDARLEKKSAVDMSRHVKQDVNIIVRVSVSARVRVIVNIRVRVRVRVRAKKNGRLHCIRVRGVH